MLRPARLWICARRQAQAADKNISKLDGDTSNDNVPFCDMRFGDAVKVLRGSTIVTLRLRLRQHGEIPGAPDC